MKTQLVSAICAITALLSATAAANAQAPSSVAGCGVLVEVMEGTYPFSDGGYSVLLPANSGSSYQIIDIGYISGSTGTYNYIVNSSSTATMNMNDSSIGSGIITLWFSSPPYGSYHVTTSAYPGAYQDGYFSFAWVDAPSSLAGKSFRCSVNAGDDPYAYCGSYTMTFSASGNTYVVIDNFSGCVANSSGTYSYSFANRSTGKIQATDSISGAGTAYLGFKNEREGFYAITQTSTGGFQVGTFRVLDTIPPTVSITNPPSARTYTSVQTVNIGASASDDVGVVWVQFYDGSTHIDNDSFPPYSYDWSLGGAANGPHVWTVRAYDAAGNISTSSPVTLTVSIDTTLPTVAISSPTNGANFTTATTTVSGTASGPGSPSSGLSRVEVRLNGGSWTNATGTTSWTRSVTLLPCGNKIEARSLDMAGNYSAIASNFVTYTPANAVPNTPTNVSPANGAKNVSLTPLLQASPFLDPDPPCIGDIHAASQWQVLNSPGNIIVADSGTNTMNKLSWTVPAATLYSGSNYQWQVRYRDSRDGWSSFSTRTFFTNGSPAGTVTNSGLIRSVKPVLEGLVRGTNYQLQVSGDLLTWTNHGVPFVATNSSMFYPQYWNVDDWGKLYFRLQFAP
ncbi:MAG: hypothetical protein IH623_30390 [Verrucomicrobia bacterium]|nr:hypothetical protein [Verrucomicrobiota bacterium]